MSVVLLWFLPTFAGWCLRGAAATLAVVTPHLPASFLLPATPCRLPLRCRLRRARLVPPPPLRARCAPLRPPRLCELLPAPRRRAWLGASARVLTLPPRLQRVAAVAARVSTRRAACVAARLVRHLHPAGHKVSYRMCAFWPSLTRRPARPPRSLAVRAGENVSAASVTDAPGAGAKGASPIRAPRCGCRPPSHCKQLLLKGPS
jgi:hypothetical protein